MTTTEEATTPFADAAAERAKAALSVAERLVDDAVDEAHGHALVDPDDVEGDVAAVTRAIERITTAINHR